MRFFVFIIASFILFSSFAGYEGLENDVWINANPQPAFAYDNERTIYFPKWNDALHDLLNQGNHFIALQLDDTFDPLPDDGMDMPKLMAIASVASPEIRSEYFVFLERFSRTKGISYLVLPDTSGLTNYEKQVIHEANHLSPNFFILKNMLSYELPESKKDFVSQFSSTPQILIASSATNLKKINKWGAKYLPENHQKFLAALKSSRDVSFNSVHSLPPDFEQLIFETSAYAIDTSNALPLLTVPRITYLGSNEKLRTLLSRYVQVLGHREEGTITIVDHLDHDGLSFQSGDLVLTQKPLSVQTSQLVFPLNLPQQEVHIAKMIFGATEVSGRNTLARPLANHRLLSHSTPHEEGFSPELMEQIDSLGYAAISKLATPGLQVAVVKNGSLVLGKSMGFYTYDSIKAVENGTVYDLASLTKVMATLPAIAWLVDRKMIHLDDSIAQFLPEFEGSNKSGITIRQLLAHNAGLKSYLPFWKMMMDGDRLDAFYYKTPEDEANDIRSYGFEPHPIMIDSLKSFLVGSDLIKHPEQYNYSDLGYMILHLMVERVTGQPFDQFLKEEFYHPMGLNNTTFNPTVNGISYASIAPTEYDRRFRDYQVWGEVHDRNAAVFGGVSGHAGLFSNATDLAKMMCMFLNGGYYGGRRYLSENTLSAFNFRHFDENRRGLGWDKNDPDNNAGIRLASDESFGHTGFTGTMVWADPKEDLIFVFLSNRIYPNARNNRLSDFKTRTLMYNALYQSMN